MGFKKNNAQALVWFRRAAEWGSALAQYNAAVMYEKGLGAAQNDLAAFKYYMMAAQQGNADAAFSVGKDYTVGIRPEVPKDPMEAYAWLSVADSLGNPDAAGLRESVIHSLSTHDLTKAQILFKKYLAQYGHQAAQ
jgi:TPR repeat protein